MSAVQRLFILSCLGFYSANCIAVVAPENTSSTAQEASTAVLSMQREPVVGRNLLAAQAIQLSVDAKQLIDLSTPVEHFSALFLAANVAQPRGMVILLPGAEESFDWPLVIGPLRRKLPDAGWHTLSLNLPELPLIPLIKSQVIADLVAEQIPVLPTPIPAPAPDDSPAPPASETDSEAAEEPIELLATEAPPTTDEASAELLEPEPIVIPDYPERISNFLDAAIDYAQTLGAIEIVLLGHQEGAHWVLTYQNQYGSTLPMRSALIAPRNSSLIRTPYPELIAASQQPIADFYDPNNTQTQNAAQQRLAASRRASHPDYKQVGLTTATGVRALEQDMLMRRVKGWLNRRKEAAQ